MSKDREDAFFRFGKRIFEQEILSNDVQKDGGAEQLRQLVSAFESCHPIDDGDRSLPTFEHERFHQPFTVYTITNKVTGRVYIGKVNDGGFAARYPSGWWVASDPGYHNEELMLDALRYGIREFRVDVWSCKSAEDAAEQESELQIRYKHYMYNVNAEPSKSFDHGGAKPLAFRNAKK